MVLKGKNETRRLKKLQVFLHTSSVKVFIRLYVFFIQNVKSPFRRGYPFECIYNRNSMTILVRKMLCHTKSVTDSFLLNSRQTGRFFDERGGCAL